MTVAAAEEILVFHSEGRWTNDKRFFFTEAAEEEEEAEEGCLCLRVFGGGCESSSSESDSITIMSNKEKNRKTIRQKRRNQTGKEKNETIVAEQSKPFDFG